MLINMNDIFNEEETDEELLEKIKKIRRELERKKKKSSDIEYAVGAQDFLDKLVRDYADKAESEKYEIDAKKTRKKDTDKDDEEEKDNVDKDTDISDFEDDDDYWGGIDGGV